MQKRKVMMKPEAWKQAVSAFTIEADALTRMPDYLDRKAFSQAVDALARAPRIAASGCGHTGIACQHFAHLMCCIDRPARFISPAEAMHGASGFIQAGDVVLLASRGGKTAELLPFLDISRKRGTIIITVTENMDSPLARGSDVVLRMYVTREVDKYNAQGTTSFIITCALFDALQAALIEETGYQLETFAVIHPHGAVGERLTGKH